jgi:SAM-dependent methyltransferase
MEFWSEDSDFYLEETKAEAGFFESVIDVLAGEGWLRPDDVVLDIGCGPGTLVLPISGRVRKVVALDEAEGMLRTLERECDVRGICNVSTIARSWNDFQGTGEHDLVLASQSPAIRSGEDLRAMERASRDRCCLIVSCPSDIMATRIELWELVVGEFHSSDAYSSKYPVNLLREMGRQVKVFRTTGEVVSSRPVPDVVAHYARYFEIFTEMTAEKVRVIEEYFLSRSQGGIYVRRNSRCMDLVCWKV